MKKITIVTMQLKTPGGIERFVSTLAKIFSKDFHVEIIVNYGKPTDKLAFPLPANVKLTFLSPHQPKEVSMRQIITKFKWHKIPPELQRRHKIRTEQNKVFNNYLKTLDTNYIITDRAIYNSLISKYYTGHAQKIATDHNFHQNDHKYINELINSLKGFDSLIVATKELKDFYQNKIKPTKCHLIPNPLADIPSHKSDLSNKNILSVGRLVPEKDYPTLIKIMEKIHQKDPSIHLTIIGDGPEKQSIKQLIESKKLDLCITMTGSLSSKEIASYYYNSSLFVMTSITEAFGLVLTEAMSYGVPCIALDRASGARAQLSNNVGFLVSNPENMSNEIVNLLNDKTRLKKCQENLPSALKQYLPDNVLKDWTKTLKK